MTAPADLAVACRTLGRVLVAEIDNPPVNALSRTVRAGLLEALDRLERDDGLDAMVIASRGRLFSAGADVTEFGRPIQPPSLGEVVARIDACAKPVVAAMHGKALGGGLELALACSGRVASADALMALPEVRLGLLPGSGGIVRLPRLVGLDIALPMIAEGTELAADRALGAGLLDAIVKGDPTDAAVDLARARATGASPPRRAREFAFPPFEAAARDEARKALVRRYPGREAPLVAIDLLAMASDTPFDEAARREYEACRALVASPQSLALRHLFAAERAAVRPPADAAGAAARQLRSVGIVGAGTMGRGIALACLDGGLPVTLVGRSDEGLARARASIAKVYGGAVARGRLGQLEADERLSRLSLATGWTALAPCDLVVETVAEDAEVKAAVLAAIGGAVGDEAIVVTNTSFLDIEELATALPGPERFAGLHFFNPANLMRLVETVRCRATAPDVVATLLALARRLGKVPVLVGPSRGFLVNRMLSKRTREALFLLEEGATPWQVDAALTRFGFPVGPFALADMAGLDVMAATRRARAADMSERERAAAIAERLAQAGRLGRKTGAGYYRYGEDGRPQPDAAVEVLLEAHRHERGIASRPIGDDEIVERCLYVLVDEGARLIEEGTVRAAGDIDVAWTSGLAFPAHLGGPMFWAGEIGLDMVVGALKRHAGRDGADVSEPAPLLARLAASGERFA